jgi:hypothetical protein
MHLGWWTHFLPDVKVLGLKCGLRAHKLLSYSLQKEKGQIPCNYISKTCPLSVIIAELFKDVTMSHHLHVLTIGLVLDAPFLFIPGSISHFIFISFVEECAAPVASTSTHLSQSRGAPLSSNLMSYLFTWYSIFFQTMCWVYQLVIETLNG